MCLTPAPQFPLSASSAVLLWFLSLLKRFTYRPLPAQVSCFILSLTFRMFFRPVDFLCSFCPSVPVLSQASLLGCYRKQGSELQRSSQPGKRSCLPHPQESGADLGHLIPSWHRSAVCVVGLVQDGWIDPPFLGGILLPLGLGDLQPTERAAVTFLRLSWSTWLEGLGRAQLLNILLPDISLLNRKTQS